MNFNLRNAAFASMVVFAIGCSDDDVKKSDNIWKGADMTFLKANGADWTLAENQDKISEKVTFTRQNNGPMYNYQWWQDEFDRDATSSELSSDFWDDDDLEFIPQGGTQGVRWAILDDTGSSLDAAAAWDGFTMYGKLGDPEHFYSFHNIATIIAQLEDGNTITEVVDDFTVLVGESETTGTDMPELVGKKLGVWLVDEDIYLTLTFKTWGSGGGNNTLEYTRSTKD